MNPGRRLPLVFPRHAAAFDRPPVIFTCEKRWTTKGRKDGENVIGWKLRAGVASPIKIRAQLPTTFSRILSEPEHGRALSFFLLQPIYGLRFLWLPTLGQEKESKREQREAMAILVVIKKTQARLSCSGPW